MRMFSIKFTLWSCGPPTRTVSAQHIIRPNIETVWTSVGFMRAIYPPIICAGVCDSWLYGARMFGRCIWSDHIRNTWFALIIINTRISGRHSQIHMQLQKSHESFDVSQSLGCSARQNCCSNSQEKTVFCWQNNSSAYFTCNAIDFLGVQLNAYRFCWVAQSLACRFLSVFGEKFDCLFAMTCNDFSDTETRSFRGKCNWQKQIAAFGKHAGKAHEYITYTSNAIRVFADTYTLSLFEIYFHWIFYVCLCICNLVNKFTYEKSLCSILLNEIVLLWSFSP